MKCLKPRPRRRGNSSNPTCVPMETPTMIGTVRKIAAKFPRLMRKWMKQKQQTNSKDPKVDRFSYQNDKTPCSLVIRFAASNILL
jgi:hypothetical protein